MIIVNKNPIPFSMVETMLFFIVLTFEEGCDPSGVGIYMLPFNCVVKVSYILNIPIMFY